MSITILIAVSTSCSVTCILPLYNMDKLEVHTPRGYAPLLLNYSKNTRIRYLTTKAHAILCAKDW